MPSTMSFTVARSCGNKMGTVVRSVAFARACSRVDTCWSLTSSSRLVLVLKSFSAYSEIVGACCFNSQTLLSGNKLVKRLLAESVLSECIT